MKKFLIVFFFSISILAHAAPYEPKNYSHLLGMKGFGDELLNLHFQLYKGYVKNFNLLQEMLKNKSMGDASQIYDFGALKRRVGWEYDGMCLHELYFENLGGTGLPDPKSPLYQQITAQFGSFNQWKSDFVATGSMRGIGWVILYQNLNNGNLVNAWVEEHDLGHFAGATPLLVMDVWEHAYITQFALDRGKYIDAFFSNINWGIVNQRSGHFHNFHAAGAIPECSDVVIYDETIAVAIDEEQSTADGRSRIAPACGNYESGQRSQ